MVEASCTVQGLLQQIFEMNDAVMAIECVTKYYIDIACTFKGSKTKDPSSFLVSDQPPQ